MPESWVRQWRLPSADSACSGYNGRRGHGTNEGIDVVAAQSMNPGGWLTPSPRIAVRTGPPSIRVNKLYERASVVSSESSEQSQVSAAATASRAVTKTVAAPAKKAPAKKAPA